ncbi:hypothetical protein [Floridanema aerugineum]|uniref:Uncharacterized protein n=1 Tax=Floridaenema aerugineum BLCC-F46 TaxID=3153654 RepID=A0ABV4XFG7_9CYAN
MLSPSAKDKKDNGAHPPELTPEQVRVGTNQIMNHAERLAFLKSSGIARLLGFHHWYNEDESDNNQKSTEVEVQKSQNKK